MSLFLEPGKPGKPGASSKDPGVKGLVARVQYRKYPRGFGLPDESRHPKIYLHVNFLVSFQDRVVILCLKHGSTCI